MASFILACMFGIFSHFPEENIHHHEIAICHGRCTGSAYCTACKTCEHCAYCNSGGSCGVCNVSIKENYSESGRNNAPERNTIRNRTYLNNSGTGSATTVLKKSNFTVTSVRAYFHSSPSFGTQRKGYLIKGEMSQIQSQDGIFIYTEFQNAKGVITKGWIKLSDVRVF